MRRAIKGSIAFDVADQLLGEWLGDHIEATLGQATRELSRIAVQDRRGYDAGIDGVISVGLVSRLLRKRGFRKVGMIGSGYNREPLYRKGE